MNIKQSKTVIVLGGGLTRTSEGRWRTTTFEDSGDNFGFVGDRLRIDAAYHLYQENPEIIFILSGGKGQLSDNPDAESVAEVMKQELVEMGIPENQIVTETKSGNTFQQLRETAQIIEQKHFSEVALLTSRFHVERVKTMIEASPELKNVFERSSLQYKSAEDVLLEHDRERWNEMIERVYASEGMYKRIEQEKKGIRDLREGRYKLG